MEFLILFARIVLFIIFIVAGVAKFFNQRTFRQTLVNFGLPESLAKPFAFVIPIAELLISFCFHFTNTVWLGAIAALALVGVFTFAVTVNLIKGRNPECHCFGQVSSSTISWKTLVRNAGFLSVAGFLVWQGNNVGSVNLFEVFNDFSLSGYLALTSTVLVCLLGWLVFMLWQQQGRLLLRIESLESFFPNNRTWKEFGLPIGTIAPGFTLANLEDKAVTLKSLLQKAKPLLLLFMDANCGPCNAMLPQVSQWQQEVAEKLSIIIIGSGKKSELRSKASEHNLSNILLQKDREIATAYDVSGTPGAVFVGINGRINSRVAFGAEAISNLVSHIQEKPDIPWPANGSMNNSHQLSSTSGLSIVGKKAPDLMFKDLDGKTIRLSDFRGKDTLIVFWSPDCGFCKQMLPQLRTWEMEAHPDAPTLLFVSQGTPQSNRSMALRSKIVLDNENILSRHFGASGTPSAILLDKEGKVASEIVTGAAEVFKMLAGTEKNFQTERNLT